MRLRSVVVALVAAAATTIAVPGPARASADSWACSSVGSYTRTVGGTTTTYSNVGNVGRKDYRYWHVSSTAGGVTTYQESYLVHCDVATILAEQNLVPYQESGPRCGTTTTDAALYIGSRPFSDGGFNYQLRYWHMRKQVGSVWIFDHPEMARCPV
ncbi:hypothetical protein F4553_006212 [Allocatelliglobosispora scoriae]|uniref:Secreted protein n=1 Tax=Allocatelliglobosispora scoriae TaxID=643052 RepID=A0A841BZ59_9ACTN|nr:hypothetical protein [Allocatelliglobosispora scoriae]MBB5872778.1 hypothetical protein [Allocatelliglobosispora scoriae]